MKPAAYYKGKEQTYLKHYFLERYLETVAFHIGYTHKDFVYVDCFSGPWLAADEELADTSIRIALDKLNYVRNGLAAQQRYANIRAVFVEKDSAAFRTLQTTLDHHRGAIKTTALPGTFEDNITAILQEVGTAFAFFFIDPKGWSGFAMDNIAPILRHQPGEVMVNFMYDFINRFINYPDPANEQSLGRFFGTTTTDPVRATPTAHPRTAPRLEHRPYRASARRPARPHDRNQRHGEARSYTQKGLHDSANNRNAVPLAEEKHLASTYTNRSEDGNIDSSIERFLKANHYPTQHVLPLGEPVKDDSCLSRKRCGRTHPQRAFRSTLACAKSINQASGSKVRNCHSIPQQGIADICLSGGEREESAKRRRVP
jgi:three-Cys-motif partner protein